MDHPRTRGVYSPSPRHSCQAIGSSPHARGLPEPVDGEPQGGGIIPARAGFTDWTGPTRLRHEDHPRTRGVYSDTHPAAVETVGSSPHARGLLLAILGIPTVLESTTPRFPSLLT